MTDRYSRQELFLPNGQADQQRLGRSRVALIGCGALGTVVSSLIARAGVGFVRIVDRDYIELSNLQRQTLFDEDDVRAGLPKAVAAVKKLSLANSEVQLDPQPVDFNADNAERLLKDVDLVVDATDNFEARYLINDVCVRAGTPWIYSAVVGSYGVSMTIRPHQTACLRCVFPKEPSPGTVATCDTAGVIGPIAGVIGSLAVAEAMKLLIGAEDRLRRGLLWIDVWNNTYQSTPIETPVPGCPTCDLGRYDFLEATGRQTATLCGRDAVQVRPRARAELRLDQLAERLASIGQVTANPYLLRLAVDGYELSLFPDGRAIVKGTEDPAVARGLYARYIGT
jgi:adenylyltransferase/sulfurtransferase